MNTIFNLKRFLLLERYKKQETGKHLLWSTAIILFICILCILYDLNRGEFYFGKHTSATYLSHYVIYFLLVAPCLLETGLTKRTATLYIMLPASIFEKFLHIWIKYLIVLPIYCALLLVCLKGILSLSGIGFLQFFAAHIVPYEIHKFQILTTVILHSAAFLGYFAFTRQIILKSFALFVAVIAVNMGIVMIMVVLMPDERPEGYWMDNIVTWPSTNYPLSATAQAIVAFCNYAAPICVLFGTWVSSYLLLKEKQL